AAGLAAAGASSSLMPGFAAGGKPSPKSETLVTTLYKSLSEQQRKLICMPFDHELRSKVDNNWHVTKQRLAKDYTADQQQMVKEIFLGLHSEGWAEKVYGQVEHDGGFGESSIAIFGEPGTGKFEFVLTGRHCTRRCDGDSLEGAAFGGPIFYGHAAEGFEEKPGHPGNVYWYQAERANNVFQMLDGKQREQALVDGAGRKERRNKTVELTGKKAGLDGIRLTDLSADQRAEVQHVLGDLLAPFRKRDREESMKLIKSAGMDNLHMAFYKDSDVGDDKVWDNWIVEGPSMVWFFRGDPHVHCWANIKKA
ncbi:MAG: hypothetical protein ACI9MB_004316, partial [Verrucomicrobiales bacterium]